MRNTSESTWSSLTESERDKSINSSYQQERLLISAKEADEWRMNHLEEISVRDTFTSIQDQISPDLTDIKRETEFLDLPIWLQAEALECYEVPNGIIGETEEDLNRRIEYELVAIAKDIYDLSHFEMSDSDYYSVTISSDSSVSSDEYMYVAIRINEDEDL